MPDPADPADPADTAQGWTSVVPAADLGPGEATTVPGACPPIAVFNVDGEFFALDDTCTHAEFSLAEGFVDGDRVECDLHYAQFSIRTGEALTAPATDPLGTYPVRVVDGELQVAVASRCVLQQFRA